MKMNEKALNAYINRALNEELDELFGTRNNKKMARMITGQGYGNQQGNKSQIDVATDAGEECPQTLIGIISKLEENLCSIEKLAGMPGNNEGLANSVAAVKNNGRTKVKQSLLNAISALMRISERLGAVEREKGLNTLMEDSGDGTGLKAGIGGYLGARAGSKAIAKRLGTAGQNLGQSTLRTATQNNGPRMSGKFFKNIPGKISNVAKPLVKSVIPGVKGVAGAATSPAAIALAVAAVAQVAITQAQKARQRNIVRTYNCAAVLAKRMVNVAKSFEQMQPQQQVNEINVRRGTENFETIETNMNKLSELMQNINSLQNVQLPTALTTPEEIKQFQQWANIRGYKDKNGQPLVVDGKWGPLTDSVYNQIAQQISGRQINESKIENALATLEKSVRQTGGGGNAYANISAMSGGKNGTRLQKAQNIKEVIRTYPPVLNQYLQILQNAGANVNGMQPLPVDQRAHRNYNVKEINAINQRIIDLLNVAQNFSGTTPTNLPPKPVVNKPKPKAPVRQTQPQPQQPVVNRNEYAPISDLSANKGALHGGIEQSPETIQRTPSERNISTNIGYQMLDSSMTNAQRNTIKRNAIAGVNQNTEVSPAVRRLEKGDIRRTTNAAKQAMRESKKIVKINEAMFKDVVNEVLQNLIKK